MPHPESGELPATYRVLHVSDTHLSRSADDRLRAWSDLVKYSERAQHDLLIHTGDHVADDPDADDDHEFAAAQWRRLTVPSRAIPGNHDVGDSEPDPYRGVISVERIERYRSRFGADRWSLRLGQWLLVGLNSQLFDNCLPQEEDEQWDWLDDQLSAHPDACLALFLHKPPCLVSLSEPLVANKTIGPRARARLLDLALDGRLQLIGCGHLHEYASLMTHGVLVVAAPSLALGSKPDPIRALGLRCDGAVEYVFSDDGVRFQLLHRDELSAPRTMRSPEDGG